MGTDKAGPSEQPGGQEVTAPRLAVVLGRPADASRICRVDAPSRVLRIWALLNRADDELRHLISQRKAAVPMADELRVEYASLLGWIGGLVIEMLSQIEVASEKAARSGLRTSP